MIDAADRARDLADRYWESILELEPMMGTEIGDERYDDRWMDPTETGRARSETVNRAALREREGIDAGVTTPRVVAERAVASVERLLALEPHNAPPMGALGDDATDDARDRIAGVVRDAVNPALERHLGVLREYLPHATETIALSALPGGAEMYATEVLAWTTLPLEPARVHELGRARFERIQQERREI